MKQDPIKYELSAQLMEQVFRILSNAPWMYVNDAINLLRANAKPIYPEEPKKLPVKTEENPS